MKVTGNSDSTNHWRLHFDEPPTVILNGEIMHNVSEALAGEFGYVVVSVTDDAGKPLIGNVVLESGEVVDRIWAERTLHGRVEILSQWHLTGRLIATGRADRPGPNL